MLKSTSSSHQKKQQSSRATSTTKCNIVVKDHLPRVHRGKNEAYSLRPFLWLFTICLDSANGAIPAGIVSVPRINYRMLPSLCIFKSSKRWSSGTDFKQNWCFSRTQCEWHRYCFYVILLLCYTFILILSFSNFFLIWYRFRFRVLSPLFTHTFA